MRFQTKITLCITLLAAITFSIGTCILLNRSFESTINQERSAALYTYQMLWYALDAVETPDDAGSYTDLHNSIYQLDAQGGNWTALRLKVSDMILYTTPGAAPFCDSLEQETGLNMCSARMLPVGGDWYLQVTGRFLYAGSPVTLDAIYSLQALFQTRETQLRDYQVAFLLLVALSAGMSWLISGWLTHPLRGLSLVLRRITAGDLSCRARVLTHDEVGALAEDLNQMTEQLEQNIEQLRQSMQRQEQFMGSFAHELKTPMTAIIGYADLLRSQTLSREEAQSAANHIFHEGRRLEKLSLKLLDLLVLRDGQFTLEPCRPRALLREVAQTMEPALSQEGICLQYKCSPGVCRLEPDLTRTLLTNLIDNARKAMDTPGIILAEGTVTSEGCRFVVSDNGRGMEKEELDHITEPFYRVDKSRSRTQGGAGLGLALCSEIVRLHNGTISFVSRPGKGTRVTVDLKGGALCTPR